MKKKLLILGLVLLFSGAATAIWFNTHPSNIKTPLNTASILPEKPVEILPAVIGQDLPNGVIQVSESATYKNLQVFFLYANAEIESDQYVTLHDAIKAQLVTLSETGEVNELILSNHSSRYIYINSGDIVRGGKQDRTIQYDVVIGPQMKGVKLASFCVEQSRWEGRGDESVGTFSGSENSLSSKELKVAAKVSKDQSAVWSKVEDYQNKANANMSYSFSFGDDVDIRSKLSTTSLELALENKEVRKITEEYRRHILDNFKVREHAVGIACFINGKMSSIDLYNNDQLFSDLFDKLLDAAIAEAISEDAIKKYAAADTAKVHAFIMNKTRELSTNQINKVTRFSTYKTSGNVMLFVTEDRHENKWLHKNWLDTR